LQFPNINAMRVHRAIALLLILAGGLTGCASTTDRLPGQRTLDAVVIAREHEPAAGAPLDAWGFGKRSEPTGSWYLVFEARDGDATAHYRLPVTQQQYMLFQEGSDVQITLVGYDLRGLRRRQ